MFKNVNEWLDKRYDATIAQTVSWYEAELSKFEKVGG